MGRNRLTEGEFKPPIVIDTGTLRTASLHGCSERQNQGKSDGHKQRDSGCRAVTKQGSGASGDLAVQRAHLPTCILGDRYGASWWVFKAVYASPCPGVANLANVPSLATRVSVYRHCIAARSRTYKTSPDEYFL